jgi:hypothetical protein
MLLERRQNQGEDLFVNRAVQSLPNDRKTGVIRRRFGQLIMQELADGDRIGAPRGHRPLAGQVFKKTHHQHLQVHRRINPRPAHPALIVGGSAEFADLAGKPKAFQGLVQLGVEPTCGAGDHLIRRNPELGLRSFLFRDEHELQTPPPARYSKIREGYFNRLLVRRLGLPPVQGILNSGNGNVVITQRLGLPPVQGILNCRVGVADLRKRLGLPPVQGILNLR